MITVNALPYHVPNEGYYADLWTRVDAFAKANSAQVKEDTSSAPEPSEDERIALYRQNKLQEFKQVMRDIDVALSAQSIEEIEAITPITSDKALTKTLQALE